MGNPKGYVFIKFFEENKEIIVVLLIALVLRIHSLDLFPEFFVDEGHVVHRAVKLLKRGPDALAYTSWRDVYGLSPNRIFFNVMLAFFFRFFGVGIFQARIGSVVFSLLLIMAIYKIGHEMYNKKVGLLSAFLYSVTPAAVVVNRMAEHETPMALFLILGMLMLWRGFEKDDKRVIFLAGILMGISFFFKAMAIVHIPLVFTFSIILYLFERKALPIISKTLVFSSGFLAFFALINTALYAVCPSALIKMSILAQYEGIIMQAHPAYKMPLLTIVLNYLTFWTRFSTVWVPITAAFGWTGFVFLFVRGKKQDLLLISWLITFIALLAPTPPDQYHITYTPPIIANFCLSASILMLSIFGGSEKSNKLGVWYRNPKKAAFAFAIFLCIALNLGASAKLVVFERYDTVPLTAQWINDNTPEESVVMANPAICVLLDRPYHYFYFFSFHFANEHRINYFVVDETWINAQPGIINTLENSSKTILLKTIGNEPKIAYIYRYIPE